MGNLKQIPSDSHWFRILTGCYDAVTRLWDNAGEWCNTRVHTHT